MRYIIVLLFILCLIPLAFATDEKKPEPKSKPPEQGQLQFRIDPESIRLNYWPERGYVGYLQFWPEPDYDEKYAYIPPSKDILMGELTVFDPTIESYDESLALPRPF